MAKKEAEETEAPESEAGGPKKGGKKKLIVIMVVVIVLLGGAAAALRFLAPGLVPGLGTKKAAEGENTDSAHGDAGGHGGTPMLVRHPLKSFIVNLADPGGKRYLKTTLFLELDKAEGPAEVESQLAPIRDGITMLLSSMTWEDVSAVEGKSRIKTQIIARTNTFLTKTKVTNVYFDEFVVQ